MKSFSRLFTQVVLAVILSMGAGNVMGQTFSVGTDDGKTSGNPNRWHFIKTSETVNQSSINGAGFDDPNDYNSLYTISTNTSVWSYNNIDYTLFNTLTSTNSKNYKAELQRIVFTMPVPSYSDVSVKYKFIGSSENSDGSSFLMTPVSCVELINWDSNDLTNSSTVTYNTETDPSNSVSGSTLLQACEQGKSTTTATGECTWVYSNKQGASSATMTKYLAAFTWKRTTDLGSYSKCVHTGKYGYYQEELVYTYYNQIKYNLNGGTSSDISNTTLENVSHTVTSVIPTKHGYTFTGWKDENNNILSSSKTYNKDIASDRGIHTLTAQWTPKQYTLCITINKEGATIGGVAVSKNLTMTYGSTTNNAIADIECAKWNLVKIQDASGNTVYDNNGNSIKGNDYFDADGKWINDPAGGVIYTIGVWEGKKTTITLNASPGTFDGGATSSSITLTQGSSDHFRNGNLTPVYSGYKFMGGYTEPNGCGTCIYRDHSIATTDGNYWTSTGTQTVEGYDVLTWDRGDISSMTLYAYWVPMFSPASSAANEKNIKIEQSEATDEVTDADIAVAKNNMGANANTLIYIDKGSYSGTASNILVKENGSYKCSDFVVVDKTPVHITTAFTATTASYERTLPATWGTICLPFAVTSDDNIQYYKFDGLSSDGKTINFTHVASVAANTPAAFKRTAESTEKLNVSGTDVAVPVTSSITPGSDITFIGVQDATVTLPVGGNYYYIANDKFWQPKYNAVTMYPQRAYFTVTSSSGAKALSLDICAFDEFTSSNIDGVNDDQEAYPVAYYDVTGKARETLAPGLNIVRMSNGKSVKIFVK